jgi:molybdate transport system ATP-binding protein
MGMGQCGAMNDKKPLITFKNVTTRIRDRRILENTTWTVGYSESWAVIGPNGSGKTSLTRLLVRELPVIHGTMEWRDDFDPSKDVAVVSFETQKRLFVSEERKNDARHYSGRVLEYTSVREILEIASAECGNPAFPDIETAAGVTDISHLLERNVTRLSTGEFRKVLVARALVSKPKLLVLDEPLEGLDAPSREQLRDFVNRLIRENIQVIFVTHRLTAIPSAISRIICLNRGTLVAQGNREEVLSPSFIEKLYGRSMVHAGDAVRRLYSTGNHQRGTEMVFMKDVRVKYGNLTVFERISWTVSKGDKWLVKGRNGSGKSTLLSLISGDNPQAYSNNVRIFGKQRGSGESIWDIKRRIGLVSSEFQLRYQKEMTVLDVVLSGFFDSVGLYRKPTPEQAGRAMAWIELSGFKEKSNTLFTHLSFGEQKLVLIARAMVKSPELLILDEPCQGLDPVNRKMVLELLDSIAGIPETTVIYVTHHTDETPSCFGRELCL